MKTTANKYDRQAEQFLTSNGIKFRATLSDTKTPAWSDNGKHGHHYRVTLSGIDPRDERLTLSYANRKLVFDFWGSIADASCKCCNGAGQIKLDKPEPVQVPNPMAGIGNQPSTLAAWKRTKDCAECNGSGQAKEPIHPSAYDVLACISGDAYCPETFADFCAEHGYDKDSIKALQTFRRCSAFAKRLRAFFTEAELEQLQEIQ